MKKIILTLLILMYSGQAFGTEINQNASVIFPVMENGAWPRALAMAGAFTSAADDIGALYWNPAGLSKLKETAFTLTYDKWFMDSYYQYLMTGFPLSNTSAAGINFFYMDLGSFTLRDPGGNLTGTSIGSYYAGASAGYGQLINENFHLGAAVKILAQIIDQSSTLGVAADAGLIFTSGDFSAGIAVRNLGMDRQFQMPVSLKAGVSYLTSLPGRNILLLSFDFKTMFKDRGYYKFGTELNIEDVFFIRAGYEAEGIRTTIQGLTGLTTGLGLKVGTFLFDYAFVPFGELGYTHRAALTFMIDDKKYIKPPVKDEAQETAITSVEAEVLFKAGLDAEAVEDYKTAILKYREALKNNNKSPKMWKKIGTLYKKTGKNDYALTCLYNALKLSPDDEELKSLINDILLEPIVNHE